MRRVAGDGASGPTFGRVRVAMVVALLLLGATGLLLQAEAGRRELTGQLLASRTAAAADITATWIDMRAERQRATLYRIQGTDLPADVAGRQDLLRTATMDGRAEFALLAGADGELLVAEPPRPDMAPGTELAGRFPHLDAVLAGAAAAASASDRAVTDSGRVLILAVRTTEDGPVLSTAADPQATSLPALLEAVVADLPGAEVHVVEPTSGVAVVGELLRADGDAVGRAGGVADGMLDVELTVPRSTLAAAVGGTDMPRVRLLLGLLALLGGLIVWRLPLLGQRLDAQAVGAARAAAFFEASATASLLLDPRLRVVRTNPALVAATGWQPHELLGQDALELLLHDSPADRDALTTTLHRGGAVTLDQHRWTTSTGSRRTGRLQLLALSDTEGASLGVLAQLTDLTDELDALTALARSRDELLRVGGQVAHDLLTPLTAASGLADLLSRGDLADDEQLLVARRVATSTRRAAELVRTYYDDARSTDRIAWAPTDLREVLAWLDGLAGAALEDLDGTLVLEADEPLAVLPGQVLRAVLSNLVDNALKYRRPDTPPRLVLRRQPAPAGEVHVTLQDNGPGVQPGELEGIFEPGRRGSDAVGDGRGSGLATCRGLVEAVGGRVWAELGGHGGLAVHVMLPSAPSEAGDRADALTP